MRAWVVAGALALGTFGISQKSFAQDRPEFAAVTADHWAIYELGYLRRHRIIDQYSRYLDGPETGFQYYPATRYEIAYQIDRIVNQWGLVPKFSDESGIDSSKGQDIMVSLLFEFRDVFTRFRGAMNAEQLFAEKTHSPLNASNWYQFLQTQPWAERKEGGVEPRVGPVQLQPNEK